MGSERRQPRWRTPPHYRTARAWVARAARAGGVLTSCCGARSVRTRPGCLLSLLQMSPHPSAHTWICARARKGRGRVRASSGARRRHETCGGVACSIGRGAGRGAAAAERSRALLRASTNLFRPVFTGHLAPPLPSVKHTRPQYPHRTAVGPARAQSNLHTNTHTHERKQTTSNDSWPLRRETDSMAEVEPRPTSYREKRSRG